MNTTLLDISKAVASIGSIPSSEKEFQESIATAFTKFGIAYKKEKSMAKNCRPDFMVGKVAVEVKIKGGEGSILSQCMRYARLDTVDSVVLITTKAIGMNIRTLNNKPFLSIELWKNLI